MDMEDVELKGRKDMDFMDKTSQSDEKAWANKFDEEMHFACPNNGAIVKVESEHSWTREDRQWLFECADIVSKPHTLTCAWTKEEEVNVYDHPFYYECPTNHFMAGNLLF